MTENPAPPPSTNRWYSILGFQFSRQQAKRAALLLAAGGLALCVAFAAWYIPPRATSRLIRSVGGWVVYRSENVPNQFVNRLLVQPMRLFGFTATDEEVEFVHLFRAKVTDDWLHHLKPLEGLQHLQIHERQLGPGLADLAELPELTTMVVWHLRTGDLGHLQHLPNLKTVLLIESDCGAIDLGKLALLPKLTFLEVASATLTARQFEQIAQIKTLLGLSFSTAQIDSAEHEGLALFAKLPSLQNLFMREATDTAAMEIAKLESLTFLMLEGSNLSDEGAAALAKLTRLQHLQLQNCVRPLDIEALRKQLPRCQINYSVRQSPTR